MKTADLLRQKQIDNLTVASCERDGYGVELLPDTEYDLSTETLDELIRLAWSESIT